jgi:hypothetical protein
LILEQFVDLHGLEVGDVVAVDFAGEGRWLMRAPWQRLHGPMVTNGPMVFWVRSDMVR